MPLSGQMSNRSNLSERFWKLSQAKPGLSLA